jgi:hypothetical protein
VSVQAPDIRHLLSPETFGSSATYFQGDTQTLGGGAQLWAVGKMQAVMEKPRAQVGNQLADDPFGFLGVDAQETLNKLSAPP